MYTKQQLAEFAKMGYKVDANGNLANETKLQKIVNAKKGLAENIALSMAKPLVQSERYSDCDQTGKTNSSDKKWFRKNLDILSEEQRMERGLVTKRRPGYVYSALPDGTKICRCCQDRKPLDFFNNTLRNKDGKSTICKDCDHNRQKSYLKEKFNK